MVNAPSNQFRRYNRIITSAFPELSRVQNGIADSLDDVIALLQRFTPLAGKLVQDVAMSSETTLNVDHKLGYAYSGMFPVSVLAPNPIRLFARADAANLAVPIGGTVAVTMKSVYDPDSIIVSSPSVNIVFPRDAYVSMSFNLAGKELGADIMALSPSIRLVDSVGPAFITPRCNSGSSYSIQRLQVLSSITYNLLAANTSANAETITGNSDTLTTMTVREHGEAMPYIDSEAETSIDKTLVIPIRSERACTADIWVW